MEFFKFLFCTDGCHGFSLAERLLITVVLYFPWIIGGITALGLATCWFIWKRMGIKVVRRDGVTTLEGEQP